MNNAAPAARTSSRSPMSTRSSARTKSSTAARSAVRPACLSSRPNPRTLDRKAGPETPTSGSVTRLDLREVRRRPLTADHAHVLLVLEQHAEGWVDDLG